MTENANFKNPSPTVEAVSGIITEFFDALNLCKDGDRLKVAIKNQKREALITTLHQWASYVLFKSNGDSVVAFSSGYTIGKTSTPTAPLIKPANLSIENGINQDELVSNVNRVKDAVSYLNQITLSQLKCDIVIFR